MQKREIAESNIKLWEAEKAMIESKIKRHLI